MVSPTSPEQDQLYMALALAEAKKCVPINSAFCVGAVLLLPFHSDNTIGGPNNDIILAKGYSRELDGNTHAEQCCLMKYRLVSKSSDIPKSAVLFTTMEPCVHRLSGNEPCVERILHAGIRHVKVGVFEPNTFVKGNDSATRLREAGVSYEKVEGWESQCLQVARRGHDE